MWVGHVRGGHEEAGDSLLGEGDAKGIGWLGWID